MKLARYTFKEIWMLQPFSFAHTRPSVIKAWMSEKKSGTFTQLQIRTIITIGLKGNQTEIPYKQFKVTLQLILIVYVSKAHPACIKFSLLISYHTWVMNVVNLLAKWSYNNL